MDSDVIDVAVIGGGVYGGFTAYEVAKNFPSYRVVLLEALPELFGRASQTNQGQLHEGYVYSGDPALAVDCANHGQLFRQAFPGVADEEVTTYYGIHQTSRVTPAEYEAFCEKVGLALSRVPLQEDRLFGAGMTAVYETSEKAFNARRLRSIIEERLKRYRVDVRCSQSVVRIGRKEKGFYSLHLAGGRVLRAKAVVNATFADINGLHERSELSPIPMHYATFLHFLVELPAQFQNCAAMVVQGEYCLVVPSSFRGGHIFAAAKHRVVGLSTSSAPSEEMTDAEARRIYRRAVAECKDFVPALAEAAYRGYTIGTRVAALSEDDGSYSSKSLFYPDFDNNPGYHVLLGGKVTCVHETLDVTIAALSNL